MRYAIASIILFLDQLTKFLANRNLPLNQPIPIIKGFFYLTLVRNRGAAFGILKNYTFLFILVAMVTVILIYRSCRKENKISGLYGLALSFILSGALGNLIDRLFFGYVIDFLDFRIWPVFNVADSAITAGAVLLGLSILKIKI